MACVPDWGLLEERGNRETGKHMAEKPWKPAGNLCLCYVQDFALDGPGEILSASYKTEKMSLLKNLSRVPHTYIILFRYITLFRANKSIFPLGLLPTHPHPHSPVPYTPSIPETLNFWLSTTHGLSLQQSLFSHSLWCSDKTWPPARHGFLIYQMGLLTWIKSKVPSNSSGWWYLHYSSKAIMTHGKSNLVILSWRKALGIFHLQDHGLIEFALREDVVTSTLDFIRYENTVKEERRGHLSCTNKLSFSKSPKGWHMESPTFSTFKFKMAGKNHYPQSQIKEKGLRCLQQQRATWFALRPGDSEDWKQTKAMI